MSTNGEVHLSDAEAQPIDAAAGHSYLDPVLRSYAHYTEFFAAEHRLQSEREAAVSAAMLGIVGLTHGFAAAMRHAHMPVTLAVMETGDPSRAGNSGMAAAPSARIPLWVVLKGRNLSGQKLMETRGGYVQGRPAGYYGIPPGSIISRVILEPEEVPIALEKNEVNGEKLLELASSEKAIGITPRGSLALLTRQFDASFRGPCSIQRAFQYIPFRVANTDVTAEDLFDAQAEIQPNEIIAVMKARLDVAAKTAQQQRTAELQTGKLALRPPGYYEPQTVLTPILQDALPKPGRLRRLFGKK